MDQSLHWGPGGTTSKLPVLKFEAQSGRIRTFDIPCPRWTLYLIYHLTEIVKMLMKKLDVISNTGKKKYKEKKKKRKKEQVIQGIEGQGKYNRPSSLSI